MTHPTFLRRILTGMLVLTLSGCAVFRGPAGPPEEGTPGMALDTLAARVNLRAESVETLRGSADLIVSGPKNSRSRKLDVSLAAQRPGHVRVRARYGILATIFDLVADEDSLWLYLPRDRALLADGFDRGGRQLPLVASREILDAVLAPSIDPKNVRGGGAFLSTPDGYEVVVRDSTGARDLTRVYFFERKKLRLMRQTIDERDDRGRRRAVITYGRHEWTGRQWFPRVIRLELPDSRESLELHFLSYQVNPVLAAGAFALSVPAGTRRIGVEDLSDDFMDGGDEGR